MYGDFMKFNLRMLPIHIILCVILGFGFILTAEKDNWYPIGFGAIIQLYILGSIPNFIFYLKRRKKINSLKYFITTLFLFVTPYILTVLILSIAIFNFGFF